MISDIGRYQKLGVLIQFDHRFVEIIGGVQILVGKNYWGWGVFTQVPPWFHSPEKKYGVSFPKTLKNWAMCYYNDQCHRKVSKIGGTHSVQP